MRRSAIDRPRVLNDEGERLVNNEVYARRGRKRASWGDCMEIAVLVLEATGQLCRYTQPGIDPLDAIQAFNETDANT